MVSPVCRELFWRSLLIKCRVDRRLNVVVADGSNDHQISSFVGTGAMRGRLIRQCINKSQHVLIIGYERVNSPSLPLIRDWH